jgi:hypothetical protein
MINFDKNSKVEKKWSLPKTGVTIVNQYAVLLNLQVNSTRGFPEK